MTVHFFRYGFIGVCVAVVSCAPAGHRSAETAHPSHGIEFHLRDFRLKSGLRVVVEEDTSAPVAGVITVVGVGSTADPPGKEGLAHLVEHLTFRAKAGTKPPASIKALLGQAGAADMNASTDFDATVYHEVGPQDSLVDLLTLEGLRMVDPLANLDDASFATEREVVQNEIRERGETNAIGSIFAAAQAATFPAGHPYARPVAGTHASVATLTLEDARAFVRAHYKPSNMTVVVIGDVKLAGFEKTLAQSWSPALSEPSATPISTLPRLAPQAPEPPEPPPARGLTSIRGQVATPEIYVTWSLPRGYDATSYLGELAVASAQQAVSDASGIDEDVVGGSAFLVPGEQASMLVARIVLRDGTHPQASADRVLGGLYRAWVTADGETPQVAERRFAQRLARIVTATMMRAESVPYRGEKRARFAHFAGDPALYSRELGALARVDRGQQASFDRRYVNRERARLVLVRPLDADARFEGDRALARPEAAGAGEDATGYDVRSIPKVARPVGFASAFTREQLPNGLVIEAARHGTLPLVTVGISFRAGSSEEPSNGAAKLALSLAHSGRPLHGRFEDFGAVWSRDDQSDEIAFRVTVQAQYLRQILAVLADHVDSLRVHDGSLPDFQRDRLPYVRRASARPENVAARAFNEALFGSHPYAHVGTLDGELPSQEDANRWLRQSLVPSLGTLVIVGDVDAREALEAGRDAFKGWSNDTPTRATPPVLPEAGSAKRFVTPRPGSTQADVRIGCRLPPVSGAEGSLLYGVLDDTLESRLTTVLRARMGTTYGIHVGTTVYRGGSATLTIWGSIESGALPAALRVIRAELAGADRLRETDYDLGRWSAARSFNLRLSTSAQWRDTAMELGVQGWPLASEDERPRVLTSFSASERARFTEAMQRCANEGVVSIVGDDATARQALSVAWP
jgi:zinc protease